MALSESAERSDEELMRRVQADDTGAFAELYDRHAVRALRVARAVDHDARRAEEAVQEGFLSVCRSRASYRPDVASFQVWAMKIVRYRAVDCVRRETAGHPPRLADINNNVISETATGSPQDEGIARSEGDALRAYLQQLPDAQAEVITLAFFGELTHSEIATQLSLPEGTVKGRMRLGLDKLRSQMETADELLR